MVRLRSVVLYFLSVVLFSYSTHAPLNAAQTNRLYESLMDVLGTAAATDYRVAQEFKLELPYTNQELYVPFFPASGDLLSPLPEIQVSLRTGKQTTPVVITETPNLATIAKILTQDALFAQSKQLPLISWLAEQKLNPCKVFFLKMLLLAKDFCIHQDLAYVQKETLRLMIRLSLTENNGITDPNKPLSSYLPNDLTTLIKVTCPAALDIMNSFWKTLISKTNTEDVATTLANSRSFVGVVLGDATEASIIYKALSACPSCSFSHMLETLLADKGFIAEKLKKFRTCLKHIDQNPWAQKLYARQSFYDVDAQNVPADMPAELLAAVLSATTMPQAVMITVGNETWLGQINTTLNLAQTIKVTGVTLVTALKKYVAARSAYFKTHPEEAKTYIQAWLAREQHTKLVTAFLATEEGKASTQRINQAREAISKKSFEETSIDTSTIESDIATLDTQLEQCTQTLQKIESQVLKLRKAHAAAEPMAAAKLNKSIQALEKKLEELRQKHSALTTQKCTLKAQLDMANPSHNQADQNDTESYKNTLDELNHLVQIMQQNSLDIPTHITQRIQELHKNIVAAAPQPVIAQPNTNALQQQAQQLAAALHQEAKVIHQEFAQRSAATAHMAQDDIKRIQFELVTTPMYKAYIAHLEEDANNATQPKPWLSGLIGNTVELNALMSDLSGNNQVFKTIKNELIDALTIIAQHSTLIQRSNMVLTQVVALYLPEFAPILQEIVQPCAIPFFG